MALLDDIRQQTSDALAVSEDELDYLTDEYVMASLGAEVREPEWESDAMSALLGDMATEPPPGLSFQIHYAWKPFKVGRVYYWSWYLNSPPRGSCATTTGRRSLDTCQSSSFTCPQTGARIYQIGWWA